jgi:hypothetical protein
MLEHFKYKRSRDKPGSTRVEQTMHYAWQALRRQDMAGLGRVLISNFAGSGDPAYITCFVGRVPPRGEIRTVPRAKPCRRLGKPGPTARVLFSSARLRQ